MHLAEQEAQPDKFGTIPLSMWWAVVTLTTVGYGDVVPVTIVGRMIAGVTMIGGLMMLALPIGVISTAFAEQIHRQEFVVTWGMLARVPLFARLSASGIADIMRYLHARSVSAGTLVVRRGDPALSMYFITAGEVEVETKGRHIILGEGDFFGEMALLRQSHRSANVRARTSTQLLVLDARDVRVLMENNEDIRTAIEAIVQARSAADPLADQDDSHLS
jgi:voltage-gated potassium channel